MVSQLEARSRIRFSVRVLSNSPFRVQEIPRVRAAPHARSPGPALIRRRAHRVTRSSGHALIRVPASSRAKWNVYERKIEGAWVDGLAGGPRQWTVNPMYRLQFGAAASTPGPIEVALLLEAMRTYSVNVSVYDYRSPIISPSQNQRLATSGDYRAGFCYVEPPALQGAMGRAPVRVACCAFCATNPGPLSPCVNGALVVDVLYVVVVSTFLPNQLGPFFLTVQSARHPFRIEPIV